MSTFPSKPGDNAPIDNSVFPDNADDAIDDDLDNVDPAMDDNAPAHLPAAISGVNSPVYPPITGAQTWANLDALADALFAHTLFAPQAPAGLAASTVLDGFPRNFLANRGPGNP